MTEDRIHAITFTNAALDVESERFVLRGVLTAEALKHLRVDDYQRETLTTAQRASIRDALEKGEPLPDMELGVRSDQYSERDGKVRIKDHVFIIDGFQRRETILEYLTAHPDAVVRIGAVVWFNTTREWERDRFHILNAKRVKVSPNVLLRNIREKSNAIASLWGLTQSERTFVMHGRICWEQNAARGELITAMTFARVANFLHAHKGPIASRSAESYMVALDRTVEGVGIQAMRENIRTFWNLIDECWGIQRVHQRNAAAYLKGNFLDVLAKLLSDHYDFWEADENERRLFVPANLRRKLAQFDVNDLEVVRLSGSSGKARDVLYHLMRDHINSGRRTRRLRSRTGGAVILAEVTSEAEEVEPLSDAP